MYRFLTELLQPPLLLFLLAALALANLWRKRRETRGRLLLLTVPFLLLAVCCTPAVNYLALGSLEWPYPPLKDRPADVGAIVVLSGNVVLLDEAGTRTELGEDTLYRCLHAAELYRQGPLLPVLVSGGKADPDAPGSALAPVMRDFLVAQGVRPADLIVEDQSRTTYENAVESCRLLRERKIDRVLLVTDAASLRRAEGCFRKQGMDVVPSGCRYRALGFDWESPFAYLPNPASARGGMDACHEWLGCLWYALHGRM